MNKNLLKKIIKERVVFEKETDDPDDIIELLSIICRNPVVKKCRIVLFQSYATVNFVDSLNETESIASFEINDWKNIVIDIEDNLLMIDNVEFKLNTVYLY